MKDRGPPLLVRSPALRIWCRVMLGAAASRGQPSPAIAGELLVVNTVRVRDQLIIILLLLLQCSQAHDRGDEDKQLKYLAAVLLGPDTAATVPAVMKPNNAALSRIITSPHRTTYRVGQL